MTETVHMRCFLAHEREALVKLKQNYARETYRGFLPESNLQEEELHRYANGQVERWLAEKRQISVIPSGKVLAGYIVYGPECSGSSVGLITDVGWAQDLAPEMKRSMVASTLEELQGMGMQQKEIWLLRHNLSGRFLFESMGFRCLHEFRTIQRLGQELEIVRYRYRQEA